MNPTYPMFFFLLVLVSVVLSSVHLKEDKIDVPQRVKRGGYGGGGYGGDGGAPAPGGGGGAPAPGGGGAANIANVNINQQNGCNGRGPQYQWAYTRKTGWVCINIINVIINQQSGGK
ncbi:hypothetical protein niasHT_019391 [Heterodera trifolii]|uniref:Glycine-rich protein n=1 Tax=Heterodera trifolii TaxID=157864 RepID=A0ABD2KVL9_9BILA